MRPSPLPPNEGARLAALREYAILDTLPEPAFDELTRLVARLIDVPIALVSIVDADRQWFKSRYGLDAPETARDVSFCGHAVATEAPLIVPDAHEDERFADNPLVTGEPRVRFYAGMPLRTPDGYVIGTLCAIDHRPRELSADQLDTLMLLTTQVVAQLELRRHRAALQKRDEELVRRQDLLDAIVRAHSSIVSDPNATCDRLLVDLLALTDSAYGFIGEVLRTEAGAPYLETHAITNIAWDEQTRRFHDENAPVGLEFFNLETLFGAVMTSGRPVIANEPSTDAPWGGLPEGHPSLKAFLGLPLFSGDDIVGLVGLANRPGGYDEGVIDFLEPVSTAIVRFIEFRRSLAERDRAQHALREKDVDYRRIVELSQEGIWTIDGQGRTTFANRRMADMLGLTVDDMVGRTLFDFMDAEASREAAVALERRRAGVAEQHDFRLRHRDGRDVWVVMETAPILDAGGAFQGALAMVMDVTGRRRSEQALRDSEARFRAIVDAASDGIVTVDDRGVVERVNPAVERMFGYPPDELIGRNVASLLSDDDGDALGTLLASGAAAGREVETRRRDGTTFAAELLVSAFHLDRRRYATATVRDISERKRIERMKTEFISTVSHELRTPLTSIRGSLALVAAGITGELPPQAREYVDIALSNSERLVRLINDILDIEKMQSGRIEFRLQPLPLAGLVRSAIDANQAFAVSHGVSLASVGEVPEAEVVVDEDRILQAMTNLVSNAVKFSPRGATVEIAVVLRGPRVRVSVRDHGSGIPVEFRDRVFERFAQADSSDTRRRGGTGLGLSITKALVEAMKGYVGFQPGEDGGTVFFIDLPWLAPIARVDVEGARTVLVCEDDLDVARHLAGIVEHCGAIAHVAPTLERARELLASHRYDLVTLDLMLADGASAALLTELRRGGVHERVPVVVVSGSPGAAGAELLSPAMLVTDILPKPVDEARLRRAIRAALDCVGAPGPIRVLHVEDDPDLRRVVHTLLPSDWSVSGAADIGEARRHLAGRPFDLVLLDLTLPDGSGESLLECVGPAQVIIFSAAEAPAALARRVSRALVKGRTSELQLRDTLTRLIEANAARRATRGTHP